MRTNLRFCLGLFMVLGATQWSVAADGPVKADKSPSGYLNSELPKWMKLSGEERMRVETLNGVGFKPADNTYLLHRLRLKFDGAPRTWLRLSFQAQDALVSFTNVSPIPSSQKNLLDLRIGYINIGNSEEGPVSLRIGRQGLDFGEGRLLADPNWSNVGRSFDAVRLTVHYRKLRVDAFTGASDKISTDGFSTPTPGEHFDGLYASLDRVVPKAVVEPYLFWKMEHKVKGEIIKSGNLDEKTLGVRWVGKLPFGLDYGMESAMQRGSLAKEPISAWATHMVLGFTVPDARHLPRFYSEFNRGSGDDRSKDGVHGTFDTLFPSSHDKFGVADQFCWANLVHIREGFQSRVRPNLTIGVADNFFWLANRHDGIYSSGKVTIASTGSEGTFIGQEPDAQVRWNATSRTVIDFDAGHVFAGEFLRKANHDNGFNSVVVGITQRF